jgi:spore coat polysaccharide biosynthesis protein SpsF (cytidylyltransferase family)
VDKVVIAAPHQLGVCLNEELFIGSENDVLDRYYKCAKKYGFDVVVRVTSDCPLLPPAEIDRVINRLLERDTHYVTNRPAVVDGWDCEVMTYSSLKEAWQKAKSSYDREHVTNWIKLNSENNPIFLDGPKLSVDTEEDLERMKTYVIGRKTNTNNGWHRVVCSPLPTTHTEHS